MAQDTSTAQLVIQNVAPWITAVGAIVVGIVAHRKAERSEESTRAQRAVEELHDVYHKLVNDLGAQVQRLTEQNENLQLANEKLLAALDVVNKKNAELHDTIEVLSEQVKMLKKQIDSFSR